MVKKIRLLFICMLTMIGIAFSITNINAKECHQIQTTSQIYTQNTTLISEDKTPLNSGQSNSSWALVNLLCPAITILLGYALIFRKYDIEDYHEANIVKINYKNRLYYACIIIAFFSILSFILTENINLPMVIVDQWTIFMIAFPILQFTLFIISKKYKKNIKPNVTKSQY